MKWLKPDITVITNVREDHVQELGKAEQAAQIFAAAIPENSALVTSEGNFLDIWEGVAEQKNLRLHYVDPLDTGDCAFPENTACVLGIADCLEIDRTEALKSIADYKPDAGAFAVYSWKDGFRSVFFADARAANDIESTNLLSARALRIIKPAADVKHILLLINREDRPERSELFMQFIINQNRESCFNEYLCLGHVPLSFRNTIKREGIKYRTLRNIKDLETVFTETQEHTIYIFGMGNFGGKGKLLTQWLETKRQSPLFTVQQ
jgi:poly-gamma-glutamate synthase PgsB/CapB